MTFDCIVVGGGPAGSAAAGALAVKGFSVAMAAAPNSAPDQTVETRTAALFPPAISMLRRLGAWEGIANLCTPLRAIRIVDDTGRLLRAPEVVFRAAEVGLPDLGHNVPNAELTAELARAVANLGVRLIPDGTVLSTSQDGDTRSVKLSGGREFSARLVVAADGRNSMLRAAAAIEVTDWRYPQAALATRFHHSRPHGGISTELHGPEGPCTTVPLSEGISSLVWMDRPEAIAALVEADDDEFLARLGARLAGLLGTLCTPGPRRSFPLIALIARQMGRHRIALVGESAHAMPPIGAQGLNLGLADAAVLADVADAIRRQGGDIGSDAALLAYDHARAGEVARRVHAVDLLNRSVWPAFWPLGLARGAGLHVLAAMPSMRRRLMQEGLFPPAPIPSFMLPLDGKAESRSAGQRGAAG